MSQPSSVCGMTQPTVVQEPILPTSKTPCSACKTVKIGASPKIPQIQTVEICVVIMRDGLPASLIAHFGAMIMKLSLIRISVDMVIPNTTTMSA